jgi:uncharacterized protein (TIRG00374 family)
VLATAQWTWLGILIFVQIISYASLTWLNGLSLMPFSGGIRFRRLMAILTAMAFIETAIPSAGASGVVLRARLLSRHGRYPLEAALFSLVLETAFEVIAIVSIAVLGIVLLLRRGNYVFLNFVWVVLPILIIAALVWYVWRRLIRRGVPRQLLINMAGWWNRRIRRRPVDLGNLEQRLVEFQSGLIRLQGIPLWKFLLAAYGKVILDIATLGVCFLLFRYTIPLETLVTGYAILLLLSGLASLPGGLGLADVSAPVIFANLGTPASIALAAGLTYRLTAFWLLRFIGFLSWEFLEEAAK